MVSSKIRKMLLLCAVSVSTLSACATAIDGTQQGVDFEVKGAEKARCNVYNEDYSYLVYAPSTVNLERSHKDLTAECTGTGGKTQTFTIPSYNDASGNAALNVTNGVVPGLAVDVGSGAFYGFPKTVIIDFEIAKGYTAEHILESEIPKSLTNVQKIWPDNVIEDEIDPVPYSNSVVEELAKPRTIFKNTDKMEPIIDERDFSDDASSRYSAPSYDDPSLPESERMHKKYNPAGGRSKYEDSGSYFQTDGGYYDPIKSVEERQYFDDKANDRPQSLTSKMAEEHSSLSDHTTKNTITDGAGDDAGFVDVKTASYGATENTSSSYGTKVSNAQMAPIVEMPNAMKKSMKTVAKVAKTQPIIQPKTTQKAVIEAPKKPSAVANTPKEKMPRKVDVSSNVPLTMPTTMPTTMPATQNSTSVDTAKIIEKKSEITPLKQMSAAETALLQQERAMLTNKTASSMESMMEQSPVMLNHSSLDQTKNMVPVSKVKMPSDTDIAAMPKATPNVVTGSANNAVSDVVTKTVSRITPDTEIITFEKDETTVSNLDEGSDKLDAERVLSRFENERSQIDDLLSDVSMTKGTLQSKDKDQPESTDFVDELMKELGSVEPAQGQ